jgi:putative tricarboxylic transport membrane protein
MVPESTVEAEPAVVIASGHWTPRAFRVANILGALATIAFGSAILLAAQSYSFRVGDQPGPGLFPALVGGAVAVLGLLWLVGALRGSYPLDDEVEPPPDRPALVRAVLTFAVIGVFAFALRPLGYPITAALAVGACTALAGGRWRAAVLTGVLFSVASFLLVTTVLGIQLPTGILRPFLSGLL